MIMIGNNGTNSLIARGGGGVFSLYDQLLLVYIHCPPHSNSFSETIYAEPQTQRSAVKHTEMVVVMMN